MKKELLADWEESSERKDCEPEGDRVADNRISSGGQRLEFFLVASFQPKQ